MVFHTLPPTFAINNKTFHIKLLKVNNTRDKSKLNNNIPTNYTLHVRNNIPGDIFLQINEKQIKGFYFYTVNNETLFKNDAGDLCAIKA